MLFLFPFGKLVLQGLRFIDVAGGEGQFGIDLAKIHSGLLVIVQDLESNRLGAEKRIPEDLAHRVVFRVQDIFTPQPSDISGPVAYFFRRVLHNWPDKECEQILRHLLPGLMRVGSRLLVAEYVLPDPKSGFNLAITIQAERQIRAIDLTMYSCFGGKVRTIAEFQRLFHRVHAVLKIQKVWGDESTCMKILEVVLY
jgi:O-methyltransferase domain